MFRIFPESCILVSVDARESRKSAEPMTRIGTNQSQPANPKAAYAPILSAAQMERIGALAVARKVKAGEILYEPGDDTPPVFLVISGSIKIVALAGGQEQIVTSYGPGQFSGELLMISGRKSIYRCQAIEDGTLLELKAKDLRTIIGKDAELSDLFMKAFLARRLSLREHGHGNVVILGSHYSAATLAAREFLARDGHPFTYLDLDVDQIAQGLVRRRSARIRRSYDLV